MNTTTALGIAGLTFMAGLFAGAYLTPEKTVTVEKRVEVQAAVKEEKRAEATKEAADLDKSLASTVTRINRKAVKPPSKPQPADCEPCICEETIEKIERVSLTSDARVKETLIATSDSKASLTSAATERVKVVERARPSWGVGAMGGVTVGGEMRYGGWLTRDVGVLRLGVAVDVAGETGYVTAGIVW